jgi:hypothetical protein
MAMPGMSHGATAGNPALALVLVLFMLGYVQWTVDWLAAGHGSRLCQCLPQPSVRQPGLPALARQLAAGYKVVMAETMGTCS